MSEAHDTQHLRLYLMRHGEVEDAAAGRLLGRTDATLSERGIAQSRWLAERLAAAQLSAVYSSDLQRARLTAEIVAERHRAQVRTCSAWREIDMGAWEGRTIALLHDETPELVTQLFDDPASFEYPGGESFAGFTARVQRALDQLLTVHKSGEVALVAHGGVCRTIIGSVLGIPPHNLLRLTQDYACLNVIDWYDVNPVLRLLNCGSESGVASYGCETLQPSLVDGEDYYYEGEMIVFTARYHLRRGYCCKSGCRHCPYGEAARQ
jgi:broad specificity phosphatase PhoE